MKQSISTLKVGWLAILFVLGASSVWASTGPGKKQQDGASQPIHQQEAPSQPRPKSAAKDSTQSPLKSLFNGMMDWLYAPEPSQTEQKSDSSSQAKQRQQSYRRGIPAS